jgi:hypothetical protein
MFLRRRERSIRKRIVLILFWFWEVGACSLCMFVLYPTQLLRGEKGSRQFTVPKDTDQVFLRYRFGKYQEIPTKYQPKTPNRYTTLGTTDSCVWPCLSRHLCFWYCCTSPTQFDVRGARLVSTRPTCYVSFQYSIYSNKDVADAQPAHAP